MNGVKLSDLSIINHPKGDIFHALKKSDYGFNKFGEAYFSSIKYQEIKGWKKHNLMTLNLIVPCGNIRVVLMDCRKSGINKPDQESFIIGESNYKRLTVPPKIHVAFQGLSKEMNILLNIADIEHDPNESVNLPLDSFYYNWKIEDGK